MENNYVPGAVESIFIIIVFIIALIFLASLVLDISLLDIINKLIKLICRHALHLS